MADLIDKQELLNALHERLCNPKKPEQSAGIAAAERIAQRMPAAEPRLSWWVESEDRTHYCYMCGCPAMYTDEDMSGKTKKNFWGEIEDRLTKYCPDCGARMCGGDING